MPRYYFHFSDGKRTFTDSTGIELAGMAAAQAYTTNQIRDMRAAVLDGQLQDWSGWKMLLVNAEGKIVFEVSFDLSQKLRSAYYSSHTQKKQAAN